MKHTRKKSNGMKRHVLLLPVFLVAVVALILGAAAPELWASGRVEFEEAEIFFELNDTDGDLGIHALIDGEPWKRLVIEKPNEKENLNIRLRGSLRRQGLTELFFESAEPTFDELDPEDFFNRFPEGEYEVEGVTIEGDELESTAVVTHLMPASPEIEVNGEALPENCDEDPVPELSEPFVISWDPVNFSHPDLGRTNEPIVVVNYQLVVEREEPSPLKLTFDLGPDVTEVELPPDLIDPGDELKVEVLVREESDNQTATESCFEVEDF